MSTPCLRENGEIEGEGELEIEQQRSSRRLAARANYPSQGRPDLQYAVKELRAVTRTYVRTIAKELATCQTPRWLLAVPELVHHLSGCDEGKIESKEVLSGSEWAGCTAKEAV